MKGLFLFIKRLVTDSTVSIVGTARKRDVSTVKLPPFEQPRDSIAIASPRNCEPESPMKILARYLLYGRNPSTDDASTKAAKAGTVLEFASPYKDREISAATDNPDARPSSPSEKPHKYGLFSFFGCLLFFFFR